MCNWRFESRHPITQSRGSALTVYSKPPLISSFLSGQISREPETHILQAFWMIYSEINLGRLPQYQRPINSQKGTNQILPHGPRGSKPAAGCSGLRIETTSRSQLIPHLSVPRISDGTIAMFFGLAIDIFHDRTICIIKVYRAAGQSYCANAEADTILYVPRTRTRI